MLTKRESSHPTKIAHFRTAAAETQPDNSTELEEQENMTEFGGMEKIVEAISKIAKISYANMSQVRIAAKARKLRRPENLTELRTLDSMRENRTKVGTHDNTTEQTKTENAQPANQLLFPLPDSKTERRNQSELTILDPMDDRYLAQLRISSAAH